MWWIKELVLLGTSSVSAHVDSEFLRGTQDLLLSYPSSSLAFCDNIKTFLLSIFFVEMNTTVVTTCSFSSNANIAFP